MTTRTALKTAKDEIEFLRVMLDAPPVLMLPGERDWITARIAELERVVEQHNGT